MILRYIWQLFNIQQDLKWQNLIYIKLRHLDSYWYNIGHGHCERPKVQGVSWLRVYVYGWQTHLLYSYYSISVSESSQQSHVGHGND